MIFYPIVISFQIFKWELLETWSVKFRVCLLPKYTDNMLADMDH